MAKSTNPFIDMNTDELSEVIEATEKELSDYEKEISELELKIKERRLMVRRAKQRRRLQEKAKSSVEPPLCKSVITVHVRRVRKVIHQPMGMCKSAVRMTNYLEYCLKCFEGDVRDMSKSQREFGRFRGRHNDLKKMNNWIFENINNHSVEHIYYDEEWGGLSEKKFENAGASIERVSNDFMHIIGGVW